MCCVIGTRFLITRMPPVVGMIADENPRKNNVVISITARSVSDGDMPPRLRLGLLLMNNLFFYDSLVSSEMESSGKGASETGTSDTGGSLTSET